MSARTGSAFRLEPVAAPLATRGRRRLPLRTTGLLAILGVMLLAMLLVATALLFRATVESQLLQVEQSEASLFVLLRQRIEAAAPGQAQGRIDDLDRRLHEAEADSAAHLAQARQHAAGATVVIACMAWLGITIIGTLALLFFSRLALDIRAVRSRALAILVGDRSRGPRLARNDELGDLALAVDDLADTLGRHERDLEIERRHAMHQEKLATIGSMAAGVLREIGDPIAAIDGYARAMVEAQCNAEPAAAVLALADPAQILRETARLVGISRGISELVAAPPHQWQLTSLNEIVEKATALLRYEPRLEGIAVVRALDPQLPAAMAMADRLVLLLINLMINAADAMTALPARRGRIEVATQCAGAGIELSVCDNGCGMTDAVRGRAFDPLFTTKPPGRGSGLGLPLCRSIAQEHGGWIMLEPAPGGGTLVRVWLPLAAAPAATLAR